MRGIFRWSVFIPILLCLNLLTPDAVRAEPLKITGSTQFLWGDDLLSSSQAILAQYLRMSYTPEGKNYSLTGYGRIWDAFDSGSIRDDGVLGRLYYLYLDYRPIENASLRLGRQYVNFTAGSSIMDGLTVNVDNIGPVGITVSGGRDVKFSLDSEFSRWGNYFLGVDLHLQKVRWLQLGVSYAMVFDESDRARQEFGANFRYINRYVSPYAEVRYDYLSKAIDEATAGVDIFPVSNLMIKGEFYHSYPTFNSTDIYSVFAVDRYREYLVRAEYSLEAPVTVFASYARQTYQEDANADNYILGARVFPVKGMAINASVDYRTGFGGNLWGFEIYGDYKVSDKIGIAAGVQYDAYKRPENLNNGDAQRYWLGGQWVISKNVTLSARIEDNVNENFNHRPLGRVALNWNI